MKTNIDIGPAVNNAQISVRIPGFVDEWLEKKFYSARKVRLRDSLAPGPWTQELVVHRVKHTLELEYIAERGIVIRRLADIVREIVGKENVVGSAGGSALVELVLLERD